MRIDEFLKCVAITRSELNDEEILKLIADEKRLDKLINMKSNSKFSKLVKGNVNQIISEAKRILKFNPKSDSDFYKGLLNKNLQEKNNRLRVLFRSGQVKQERLYKKIEFNDIVDNHEKTESKDGEFRKKHRLIDIVVKYKGNSKSWYTEEEIQERVEYYNKMLLRSER